MVPGHNHPHEDSNAEVYTLGYHISHASHPYHQNKIDGRPQLPIPPAAAGELAEYGRSLGGKGGFGLSEALREDSLGGLAAASAALESDVDEKHYITQRWEGGTICDMTGKPRSVEVQFHCSTAGTDTIAFLREIAICEYLVVIHTPRLCAEPLFLGGTARDGGADKPEAISCRPVVEKDVVDRMRAQKQADTASLDAAAQAVIEQPAVERPAPPEKAEMTEDTKAYLNSRSDAGDQSSDASVDLGTLQIVYNPDTGELYLQDSAQGSSDTGSQPPPNTPKGDDTASESSGAADEDASPEAIQDLSRILRDSLEGLLKNLKEANGQAEEPAAAAQEAQAPADQQRLPLHDIIARLAQAAEQDGGQAGGDGQQAQQQQPPQQGQPQTGSGRTGPNRKRAQPFPAQANLNRQGGAPAALALLQAAQRGQLQGHAGAVPQQGARAGASEEHARLASLYGKSFEGEAEEKEKRRDRQEL